MPVIKFILSVLSSKPFMIIALIGGGVLVGFLRPWEYFKNEPVKSTSIVTIEKIKQVAKLVVYEVHLNHVLFILESTGELRLLAAPGRMALGIDFGDKDTKIDAEGDTVIIRSKLNVFYSTILTDSVLCCSKKIGILPFFRRSQLQISKDTLKKSMERTHLADVRKSALQYGTPYAERHLSRIAGKPVILRLNNQVNVFLEKRDWINPSFFCFILDCTLYT